MDQDKEFVTDLAKCVANLGGRTYYVGGYVRDMILEKPNKDIDIEIHGISQDDLVKLLKGYGRVDIQGKSFGVLKVKGYDVDISQPRRERKTGDKHTDFSVEVDPFMGTEEAAKRRDFTMNALMQDVLTGDIIDHFGGMQDIRDKTIRHVNDKTFKEDPLRVLRAAQFSARFGFSIAPETKEIMSKLDLSNLPRERINEEMKKALLKSEKPSMFFDALKETYQLGRWLPEVKALIGCPQNEHFHPEGDVYNHTMMVLDNLAKYRDEADNPYALMLSGLCHDFGKPLTVTWDEEKQIHRNLGHEKAGVVPAKDFLKRVAPSNDIRDYVLQMVEWHDRPLALYNGQSSETKTNRLFDSMKHPNGLILLTCADRTTASDKDIEEYKHWLSDRLDKYEERMKFPEVTGEDLIEMGMKPSREFSAILADTHDRHLRGEDRDTVLRSLQKKYGLTDKTDVENEMQPETEDLIMRGSKIPTNEQSLNYASMDIDEAFSKIDEKRKTETAAKETTQKITKTEKTTISDESR